MKFRSGELSILLLQPEALARDISQPEASARDSSRNLRHEVPTPPMPGLTSPGLEAAQF